MSDGLIVGMRDLEGGARRLRAFCCPNSGKAREPRLRGARDVQAACI